MVSAQLSINNKEEKIMHLKLVISFSFIHHGWMELLERITKV